MYFVFKVGRSDEIADPCYRLTPYFRRLGLGCFSMAAARQRGQAIYEHLTNMTTNPHKPMQFIRKTLIDSYQSRLDHAIHNSIPYLSRLHNSRPTA